MHNKSPAGRSNYYWIRVTNASENDRIVCEYNAYILVSRLQISRGSKPQSLKKRNDRRRWTVGKRHVRVQGEGEAREGRTRTGVEAVQAQYEAGLYQIISCHTDDDAAAELTPGLAFPVNAAAANQTHLPPFTLSSSVSSKPLFLLRPSFSVSQCRMALSPSFPSPRCLIVLRSILFHSFLLSLSIFLSLRFHTVTRQRCLFRFLSAHTEGSNERLRS